MKRVFLVFFFMFVLVPFQTSFAMPSAPSVTFTKDNQEQRLSSEQEELARTLILNSLRSTSLNSTSYAGNEQTWDKMAIGTYFVLKYSHPKQMRLALSSSKATFTEAIIPVSYDHHYVLRNTNTGQYWAVTKFYPGPRYELICAKPFVIKRNKKSCDFARKHNFFQ